MALSKTPEKHHASLKCVQVGKHLREYCFSWFYEWNSMQPWCSSICNFGLRTSGDGGGGTSDKIAWIIVDGSGIAHQVKDQAKATTGHQHASSRLNQKLILWISVKTKSLWQLCEVPVLSKSLIVIQKEPEHQEQLLPGCSRSLNYRIFCQTLSTLCHRYWWLTKHKELEGSDLEWPGSGWLLLFLYKTLWQYSSPLPLVSSPPPPPIGVAVKADFWCLEWLSAITSEGQQCATDAVTIAPRWKHLWHQHGITGGMLARILACIWFADLLADGEPYWWPPVMSVHFTHVQITFP